MLSEDPAYLVTPTISRALRTAMKRREAAGHKVCVWITPIATHTAAGRRILHYRVHGNLESRRRPPYLSLPMANPTLTTV
ncbi:hypothetical protein BKA56DRAFT_593629 [Ilyonectria sp. MPI-CAGE-AT-0026]|nr:hypothetical protein BKA56DRAFT_593629 [Ilyonectria sp. MPI-CAGE-AT-0026]